MAPAVPPPSSRSSQLPPPPTFTTLPSPPFGLAFDPSGSDILAVVGGGGRGRSGVRNFVTLYDASTSPPTEISSFTPPDGDDSPQSVALLRRNVPSTRPSASPFSGLSLISGINSSAELCKRGINCHLRTFAVEAKGQRRRSSRQGGRESTSQRKGKPLSSAPSEGDPNVLRTNKGRRVDLGDGEQDVAPGSLRSSAANKDELVKDEPSALIVPLGAAQLFSPPERNGDRLDAYQRVIAISRPGFGLPPLAGRIGAVASSLAGKTNEVVVFNAEADTPSDASGGGDVLGTFRLNGGDEVLALDIVQVKAEKGEKVRAGRSCFGLVACTAREVFVGRVWYDFERTQVVGRPLGLNPVFSTPLTGSVQTRETVRYVKFLTTGLVLVMTSPPDRSRSSLSVLRLSWDSDGGDGDATPSLDLVTKKSLPAALGGWGACDVVTLSSDPVSGDSQAVIAAAFTSGKIAVFALPLRKDEITGRLQSITTISSFQSDIATAVALSPVPSEPVDVTAGPHHLKLAAASLSCMFVLHNIPLTKVRCRTDPSTALSSSSGKQADQFRYIVLPQSSSSGMAALVAIMAALVLVFALLFQGDVAASIPAVVSDSPAFGRIIQPLEQFQAMVQRRNPRLLFPPPAAVHVSDGESPYRHVDTDVTNIHDPIEISLFKDPNRHKISDRLVDAAERFDFPRNRLTRRRNVHDPGYDVMNAKFRDLSKADKAGGKGVAGSGKAVKGDAVDADDEARRRYADEIRKMLDDAPEGSFFLVRGSPMGFDGSEGALKELSSPSPALSISHDLAEPVATIAPRAEGRGADDDEKPGSSSGGGAGARHWDSLSPSEKEMWKRRLVKSGAWTEEDGEAVLDHIVVGL